MALSRRKAFAGVVTFGVLSYYAHVAEEKGLQFEEEVERRRQHEKQLYD